MMKKYRIGRVELPWTNLNSPIRHPDYYKNLEKREHERREMLRLAENEKPERERSHGLGSVGHPTATMSVDPVIPDLADKTPRLSIPTTKL